MTDREWILGYLYEALELVKAMDHWDITVSKTAEDAFAERYHHIAAAIRSVVPGLDRELRDSNTIGAIRTNRRVLSQAIYALEEGPEVMRHVGPPPGPSIQADSLHPLVWDAAKSLWRSHHRRKAVEAAAISVNAQLQDRVGRRDVSNSDLVRQAFTLDPPKPGKPRLRLRPDDGSETYRTLHDGVRNFGVGCFQALRNPIAHEAEDEETPEQIALEQLAAFSLLARWVEDAELDEADSEESQSSS